MDNKEKIYKELVRYGNLITVDNTEFFGAFTSKVYEYNHKTYVVNMLNSNIINILSY